MGISYALWAAGFCGLGGLHRFYNGKIVTGLLWFSTGNLFGLGLVLDLFLIPGMVDEQQTKLRAKLGVSAAGVPLTQPAAVERMMFSSKRGQTLVKLLQAAQARGGKLSVTQAVMDTGIDFAEVEAVLKEMAKAGYVSVANDKGVVTYSFNEL
nr:hypothetical protein [Microcoleus sp. FACHB-68]